jgi:hypothetical protein
VTYDCTTNVAPEHSVCVIIPCDATTNDLCQLKCICQGNTSNGIVTVDIGHN